MTQGEDWVPCVGGQRDSGYLFIRLAFLTLAVAMLASCTESLDLLEVARGAVDEFHSALGRNDGQAVHRILAPKTRQKSSPVEIAEVVELVHGALGAPGRHEFSQRMVMRGNSGTYVVFTMLTDFARGQGVEHFSWIVVNGRAELESYQIRSSQLSKALTIGPTRTVSRSSSEDGGEYGLPRRRGMAVRTVTTAEWSFRDPYSTL